MALEGEICMALSIDEFCKWSVPILCKLQLQVMSVTKCGHVEWAPLKYLCHIDFCKVLLTKSMNSDFILPARCKYFTRPY